MKKLFSLLTFVAAMFIGSNAFAQTAKPTIVLVHGAFADASSWNGAIKLLERDGYPVVAVANPLRGVRSDAQYVSDILAGVNAPVVLVGHSYGGNVISSAANGHPNVKALVYVSAFAPEAGETAAGLSGALSEGGKDLYIQQDKFRDQFAADVPPAEATLMAATQRPITEAALNEKSGDPAWKNIPSWFIYGDKDKNIPPRALAFMADRAHAAKTEVIKGASHVVMVSHPERVAKLIENAATAK
jgi:pimeloyl-ACP methyl ester carboxylesterase